MNPEHMTPIKCSLCGEPLDINNIYPGSLCWSCWNCTSSIRQAVAYDSKRFSDKYCCSIRDINKEEIK
jgi:hypothetical protein